MLNRDPGLRFTYLWLLIGVLAGSCFQPAYAQTVGPLILKPSSSCGEPGSSVDASPLADGCAAVKPMRSDVNLVLVPVGVTDQMNRPVTGLGTENFAIYENDQQQEIRFFSVEDSPISVGLLLDLSKSMTNKFDLERAAVSEFFKSANPQDDYFVYTFQNRPELAADSTNSIGTIQGNLAGAVPDGNTSLLDAVWSGITKMRSARYRRRALLIISDGGDNHSRHTLRQVKKLERESDVEVYAIGLFDTTLFKTFEEFMGKEWLGEITDPTGGRTIPVENLAKLPDVAGKISTELRDQYVLGYRPSRTVADGKRRRIRVRVLAPRALSSHLQASYKRQYTTAER
jgi:Ca-activated chloride channel homolog